MMKYILTSLLTCLFFVSISRSQLTVSTLENVDSIWIDDEISVGPDGSIFGSRFTDSIIYKRSPSGQISIFASNIVSPNGHDFDSNGNLIVASFYGNKLWKISPNGTASILVNNILNPSGVLKMPGSDTMIVTRYTANMILKVAPNGTLDTLSIGGILNGPVGLVYDDNDELFVANFNNRRIIHIEPNGSQSTLATLPGTGWLGFMTYFDGHFYGTAYNQHKLYDVRQSDTLVSLLCGTTMGNADGDIATAQFNRPNGIVMSSTGDSIFVSDYASGNVRVITGFRADLGGPSFFDQEGVLLHLYPNPANSTVQLEFTIAGSDNLLVHIMTENGKIVQTHNLVGIKGKNSTEIQIDNLTSGSYYVLVEINNIMYSKRFVIY